MDTAPTLAEVVQQLVSLGAQVQSLTQQLAAANSQIQQLHSNGQQSNNSKGARCGFSDGKHTVPEKFVHKSEWREWADSFMDYVEELQPTMAAQLLRARYVDEAITPTYPDAQSTTIATTTYQVLKRLVKELRGLQGIHCQTVGL